MFNVSRKYAARSLVLAGLALGAASFSAPALAQHGGYHGGGYYGGYHGGWHGGWSVGVGVYDPWWPGYYGPYGYGAYPYYAEPPTTVIVAPPAATVQVPPAAAAASYYYCDNPAGYYPSVQTCSQPWRQVPAAPQPPAVQ